VTTERVRAGVRAARCGTVDVPGLVPSGSKPRRDLSARGACERVAFVAHLRSFEEVVRYPPHQVMLGTLSPEALRTTPRLWHEHLAEDARAEGPGGRMLDEQEFYSWLARADSGKLVYVARVLRDAGAPEDMRTMPAGDLERVIERCAEHLCHPAGPLLGIVVPGHEQDEALAAPVLLENLVAQVTGGLALQSFVDAVDPAAVAMGQFLEVHGVPGFFPTQDHIASAVAYRTTRSPVS
jgi:hypothetical protein